MKRFLKVLLALAILAGIGFGALYLTAQPRVDCLTSSVEDDGTHPANALQSNATTAVWADQGKLYLYLQKTSFLDLNRHSFALTQVDTQGSRIVRRDDGEIIPLGLSNGYFYFYLYDFPQSARETAYALRLADGETCELPNVADWGYSCLSAYRAGDDSFTLVDDSHSKTVAIRVFEDSAETVTYQPRTPCGALTLCTDNAKGSKTVYAQDGQGKRKTILKITHCDRIDLFPAQSGVLAYARNCTTPLYWIDPSGTVKELFSYVGMSTKTAMNLVGNDVYLSFLRYKGYGKKWDAPVRFPNDEKEGTYVIHLDDFSVEKLSDQVYNGLYVFNDGYLYACTERGSVYQFDREWKLVKTILDNG